MIESRIPTDCGEKYVVLRDPVIAVRNAAIQGRRAPGSQCDASTPTAITVANASRTGTHAAMSIAFAIPATSATHAPPANRPDHVWKMSAAGFVPPQRRMYSITPTCRAAAITVGIP